MGARQPDPGGAPESREILSTRVLAAPRERVFQAFSDPDRLARWRGPKGFTNTLHEFDFRPGGAWRFSMHGPDGAHFPDKSVFVEIRNPERIEFRHLSRHKFRMTIGLADQAGRTKSAWRMLFETASGRHKVAKYAVEADERNLDRLEADLAWAV